MKKLLLLSFILGFGFQSMAQVFKLSFDPVFRNSAGVVYKSALAGGMNQPQFSNIDINRDGKLDLFVFDKAGNKPMVFIAELNGGVIEHVYDPTYEGFFPAGKEFMLMKDFDGDNEPDLWTYSGDSVVLYKNNTSTLPQFDSVMTLWARDKVNVNVNIPNKSLGHVLSCLPAIIDVDNDGDVDYISNLNVIGSNIMYHRNNSADKGLPLSNIGYDIVDKCYGGVAEHGFDLTINSPCFFYEGYLKKKHSAPKTILMFDNDADGDLDMFYGSSERVTNPIYFLENGKADLGHYKDTFISIDTSYFSQSVDDIMPIAPGMFYVDIDLDGVNDLILSSNNRDKTSYPVREKNNILRFKNIGTNNKPDFQYIESDYLVGDMIDFGGHSAPTFVDIDGDGDEDLIIATSGNHFISGDTADYLVYFKNIGSKSNPEFQLMDENYLNLKTRRYQTLVPSFADLDDDGDFDLYLGKSDGTISEYLNTGSSTIPSFTFQTDSYGGLQINSSAAPTFYDMDGDDVLDLLVGCFEGTIKYFHNSGKKNSPTFTLTDDTLGGIVINELITVADPFNPGSYYLEHQYFGYAAPQVFEATNGKLSMIVGGDEGLIRLYDVTSDLTSDFPEVKDYMKRDYVNTAYTKDWGKRIYPTVADLNDDGFPDILLGNQRGGISYMQGNGWANIVSVNNKLKHFHLAPNPASEMITIHTKTKGNLDFVIIDLSGKTIKMGSTISGGGISVSDFVNGIYFVKLSDRNQQYAPSKLVINK